MIHVEHLTFRYPRSEFRLHIPLLTVKAGQSVAMIGPSGSGKTTLLRLLSGIHVPESGRVQVAGVELSTYSDAERRAFRLRTIGLVFQDFALLDYLSVLDNILLPCRLGSGIAVDAAIRSRALELAAQLGIASHLSQSVQRLSQGEQQRVAVCRALLFRPRLVLADEPTGNLDPVNKQRVLSALFEVVQASGATLVTVTHDHELLSRFDRQIDFRDYYQEPVGGGA